MDVASLRQAQQSSFAIDRQTERRQVVPRGVFALTAAAGRLPCLALAAGLALLLLDGLEHGGISWTVGLTGLLLFGGGIVVRCQLATRERAQHLAEEARSQSDARLSTLVRHSRDVVCIVSLDGVISYISPSVERLLGYEPAVLDGTDLAARALPVARQAVRTLLAEAAAHPGHTVTAELCLAHVDGSERSCETVATNLLDDSAVCGIVLTLHDITERRAFERELTELALNDPLTGLPNRMLLQDRVNRALARSQRRHGAVGALLVDLDNFKRINDSLGHQTGDELLILVAERLRGCLRLEDTLARMGGDELGVLIEDASSEAEVTAVAERMLQSLREPFTIGRQTLFTSASIGIALSSPASDRADHAAGLLRNADLALYQAKERGKARWALFDPDLNAAAHERLELETALRVAVKRGELWLAYQPIVDLASGEVREVEALLRWTHPTLGQVPPTRFIPVAEEAGLIGQIGRWALREACHQAVRWQAEHPQRPPVTVGVNLSGRQLQDSRIVATVAMTLAESGLDSHLLKLELTESVLMASAEETVEVLERLKSLGVKLAIDDFGTGYSSLAYLKQFPVDVLKIDRSFVDGIGRDPRDQSIIEGIIALAGRLGLQVTAEGVETAEQADCLGRIGCDLAQGFHYARPLPAAEIARRLAAQTEPPVLANAG